MKKQAGFTLIELIMVIVILGILSAFALPRFADLSGSAEVAALEGARASVASASAIVHAQALASNATNVADQSVPVEGGNAEISFMYPEAIAEADFSIVDVAQINDFSVDDAANEILFIHSGFSDGSPCFTYTEAADSTTPPVISVVGSFAQVAGAADTLDATDTCGGVAFN